MSVDLATSDFDLAPYQDMAAIQRGFTTRDRNTRRVSSASVRVFGASGTAESPM